MNVREATPADVEAVRTVHYESIRGLGPEGYDQRQVEAWAAGVERAEYEPVVEAAGMAFLVATDERGVLGFGSLRLAAPDGYESAPDGELTGVYVHPHAADEGVGSELLAELERRARAAGLDSLGLKASLNAVGFYERRGYERVVSHDHEFSEGEGTGVTGEVVEMRKSLSE